MPMNRPKRLGSNGANHKRELKPAGMAEDKEMRPRLKVAKPLIPAPSNVGERQAKDLKQGEIFKSGNVGYEVTKTFPNGEIEGRTLKLGKARMFKPADKVLVGPLTGLFGQGPGRASVGE